MMYPFMTLEDNTEIVHSEILEDGKSVKVYIEKPVIGGFYSSECYLPEYRWQNIQGFTPEEISAYENIILSFTDTILYSASKKDLDNT